MDKTILKSILMNGYKGVLKAATYQELESKVLNLEAFKDKESISNELANQIKNKLPEFDIVHEYYVRNKLNCIDKNINTIKTILLIAFIISILAGIVIGVLLSNKIELNNI